MHKIALLFTIAVLARADPGTGKETATTGSGAPVYPTEGTLDTRTTAIEPHLSWIYDCFVTEILRGTATSMVQVRVSNADYLKRFCENEASYTSLFRLSFAERTVYVHGKTDVRDADSPPGMPESQNIVRFDRAVPLMPVGTRIEVARLVESEFLNQMRVVKYVPPGPSASVPAARLHVLFARHDVYNVYCAPWQRCGMYIDDDPDFDNPIARNSFPRKEGLSERLFVRLSNPKIEKQGDPASTDPAKQAGIVSFDADMSYNPPELIKLFTTTVATDTSTGITRKYHAYLPLPDDQRQPVVFISPSTPKEALNPSPDRPLNPLYTLRTGVAR